METMSEIYDIKELPEGVFPLSFKIIDRYQREDPILTGKLTCSECEKVSLCGGINNFELVTFKDKIVIPQLLQKYVVKWYHTYLLNPGLDITEMMICQHL